MHMHSATSNLSCYIVNKRGVREPEHAILANLLSLQRWYHQLNEYEFEQTRGDSERQGSLVCCSPWSRRVRHY